MPTVTPTNVQAHKSRTIRIAQAAATLCKPRICMNEIHIN